MMGSLQVNMKREIYIVGRSRLESIRLVFNRLNFEVLPWQVARRYLLDARNEDHLNYEIGPILLHSFGA